MKNNFLLFITNGIILELIAVYLLLKETWPLEITICIHFIACLSCVIAIDAYKKNYQHYNQAIRVFLFSLMFFLSIFGVTACILLSRWLLTAQRKYDKHQIKTITLSGKIRPLINRYGVIRLRTHLQAQDVPLHYRIDALKIISKMSNPKKNVLLRSVLPEQHDELRLLSFNLINRQENEFLPLINQGVELLKTDISVKRKALIHKWLAAQYWEILYRNLSESALQDYILKQCFYHLKLASSVLDQNASIDFLFGKIYLRQKQADNAILSFEQAIENGASALRIFPYVAEAYYAKHNYAAIRNFIRMRINVHNTINYTQIINFWLPTND